MSDPVCMCVRVLLNGLERCLMQMLYIADVVNKPDHVPRNPSAENLSNVFDTQFPTVQPYLHRVRPDHTPRHHVLESYVGEL